MLAWLARTAAAGQPLLLYLRLAGAATGGGGRSRHGVGFSGADEAGSGASTTRSGGYGAGSVAYRPSAVVALSSLSPFSPPPSPLPPFLFFPSASSLAGRRRCGCSPCSVGCQPADLAPQPPGLWRRCVQQGRLLRVSGLLWQWGRPLLSPKARQLGPKGRPTWSFVSGAMVAWQAMACSDAHLLHRGGVVGGDRALSWCLLLLCGTSKVKTITSQVRRWRRLRRRAPRWRHRYWKLRSQLCLRKNQLHKFGLRLCEMQRIHVCSRSWISTPGGGVLWRLCEVKLSKKPDCAVSNGGASPGRART
jgi:hypothetical protein